MNDENSGKRNLLHQEKALTYLLLKQKQKSKHLKAI